MGNRPAAYAATELSNADVRHFEAALLEQRRFRLDQLADLVSDTSVLSTTSASLEVVDALKHAARHALREIDLALERIRSNRYGHCIDCGGAVARGRLEVLPAVARCMACQHRVSSGRPPPPASAMSRSDLGSPR